ncbi:MAG: hypothetical protein IJ137_09315 [Eubacterium sp.]|nr:hypothetical protein [Eubacterium sp.]
MSYRKIIIAGENNVCSSFMAEVILRGLLKKKGVTEIDVVSRGLVVLFSEPVAPNAAKLLIERGYQIEDFRSAQLTEEDMDQADLVLALTDELADRIHQDYSSQTACMSLGTFLDVDASIPDVSEGTPEVYLDCFTAIEQLMEAVADRVIGELTL